MYPRRPIALRKLCRPVPAPPVINRQPQIKMPTRATPPTFYKPVTRAQLPLIGPMIGTTYSRKNDRQQLDDQKLFELQYQQQQYKKATFNDWIPKRAYSDGNTFTFGMILLGIIIVGIFFGMKRKNNV